MFEDLHPKIREVIDKKGWKDPTPAQRRAIKPILDGENILLMAPTGIGKTESACLPIFSKWLEKKPVPISILYLTPLKSLNRDMFSRLFWWASQIGMEIGVRHGDTTQTERSKQLAFPLDMLITTPESLQAILTGKKLREHLKNVKFVVVDEVHEIISSKRGTQLAVGLERLRRLCGGFQTIGLSATVGTPEKVSSFLGGAKIIKAMTEKDYDIEVVYPPVGPKDKILAQTLYTGDDMAARIRLMHDLVEKHKSSLIFTNTRESAEVLSSRMTKMEKTWHHGIHHSSLSKGVRVKAEEAFKSEQMKALIATSSLELGIDIGSIDLVMQYMSPRQSSKLIQRVGRSGHKMGGRSKGIVISSDPDDILESAVVARRAMAGELEPTGNYDGSLDVLANQIIGLLMEDYEISPGAAYEIIKKAYPYRNLKREDFDWVAQFLARLYFLWNNESSLRRAKKSIEYYYGNLSTIPDTYQYMVINNLDNTHVGVLDETFVAEYGEPGATFIVSGRPWRVLSAYEGKVFVEPAGALDSTVPAWEGELIPVHFETAQEVGSLRRKVASMAKWKDEEIVEEIKKEYRLSDEACMKIAVYIRDQVKSGAPIPDDKTFLIEEGPEFVVIHSCFGSLVNQTLSRYLGVLLTSQLGASVAIKQDPYRIIVRGAQKDLIEKILNETDPEEIEDVIRRTVDSTQMFRWRIVQVAKRFGAIKRGAKMDQINLKKLVESYTNTPIYEEAMNEVFKEKLDVKNTIALFRKVKSGEIKFKSYDKLSPISQHGIDYQFGELFGPKRPEGEILELFKERVMRTRVRLVCMKCGKYSFTTTISQVKDDPKCPNCESRKIASIHPNAKVDGLLKKHFYEKDMTKEEKKELERILNSADLVLTYGRKVLVALAGKGVGPDTAIRIMAKQKEGDGFYKDILEAERNYTKTKKYWS